MKVTKSDLKNIIRLLNQSRDVITKTGTTPKHQDLVRRINNMIKRVNRE